MTLSSSNAEAALTRVSCLACGRFSSGLCRALFVVFLAIFAVVTPACPAPTFREHGPRELAAAGGGDLGPEQRAWDRPFLEVSPPEVLAGRPARYEVVEHVRRDALWVIVLGPEAGLPVEVRYRVADGLRLPVETGEQLWLNQSSDGAGLVVRDDAGALRVLIAIDGALANTIDISITPSFDADRLIYTEVVALPSGCMLVLDHHALEVRQESQRTFVAPGARARIALATPAGEVPMELFAFDASRPTPRRQDRQNADDPRCPTLAQVSWMLVRAP